MVIYLERGADLHIAQLMPLSLTVCCFSKIQIGFTFLVPAHPDKGTKGLTRVVLDKGPLNGCVCVCVCVCVYAVFILYFVLVFCERSVHCCFTLCLLTQLTCYVLNFWEKYCSTKCVLSHFQLHHSRRMILQFLGYAEVLHCLYRSNTCVISEGFFPQSLKSFC